MIRSGDMCVSNVPSYAGHDNALRRLHYTIKAFRLARRYQEVCFEKFAIQYCNLGLSFSELVDVRHAGGLPFRWN